jgi:hypothetical protein
MLGFGPRLSSVFPFLLCPRLLFRVRLQFTEPERASNSENFSPLKYTPHSRRTGARTRFSRTFA